MDEAVEFYANYKKSKGKTSFEKHVKNVYVDYLKQH